LRSALSAKAADSGIVLVDELKLDETKTRVMAGKITGLVGDSTVLILMSEKDVSYDVAMRSAYNLKDAKVLLSNYLNIRDLLGFDKLILPIKTLDALVASLG
ncbi:MAG TPA: 50S ribosomal protein L4, partial [Anaerolineales bacterium]|nr:50S ribosomal protein L4 [Anaerolineales bacterium]